MTKAFPLLPDACCSLTICGKEQACFVGMLKAAGNPIRFEILKFLVTHPGCITGDIVDHLPITQATVSQHLKVLREAGWIEGEKARSRDPSPATPLRGRTSPGFARSPRSSFEQEGLFRFLFFTALRPLHPLQLAVPDPR